MRQLLAFSRQQAIVPEQIDLNACVRRLHTMLSRLIGESISISGDLENSLWTVNAGPGQIDQIIMNLAVNARDAMPNGETLSLRTKNMDVGPEYRTSTGELVPEGEYVMLSVEDTGVGMTEEIQHLSAWSRSCSDEPAGTDSSAGAQPAAATPPAGCCRGKRPVVIAASDASRASGCSRAAAFTLS